MTVSPDMRRNLKELTKMINDFNKIIKKLSKMHRDKIIYDGKYDNGMFKELIKKQTNLDDAYTKYYALVQQVSPNDIIPVPLSPTASASSSGSRSSVSSGSSSSSGVGPFNNSLPNFEDLQRRFEALQGMPPRRRSTRSRSRSGSTRSRSRSGSTRSRSRSRSRSGSRRSTRSTRSRSGSSGSRGGRKTRRSYKDR